jgi:hypothetical protein
MANKVSPGSRWVADWVASDSRTVRRTNASLVEPTTI